MVKKANPRRYAQAVFELALENGDFDRWQTDLQLMVAAAAEASFLAALASPGIKTEDKEALLEGALGDISPRAMNLARLLVSRSGMSLAPEIAVAYGKLLDKHRGIARADVIAAVPLNDEEKEALKERLGVLTGAEIKLKTAVDPAIIGGVIARVDGRLLDGSARGRLAALKRELAGKG